MNSTQVPEVLTAAQRFDLAFAALPLVAILRGLKPSEALTIGRVLHEAGFRIIEVPLNSPDALDSIAILRQALPVDTRVGAGTVLDVRSVEAVRAAGGDLVVMPHGDTAVIRAARSFGLTCIPGVVTPTEAFAALAAGADMLKLFPAELVTPAVLKSMRAVLPRDVRLLPVGGITPGHLAAYRAAGASGFGLGSALYAPGMTAAEVRERAAAFVRELAP